MYPMIIATTINDYINNNNDYKNDDDNNDNYNDNGCAFFITSFLLHEMMMIT